MTSPWHTKASGCAVSCTRTRPTPTARRRPKGSSSTTRAPATTCSRSPTTGTSRRTSTRDPRHPLGRALGARSRASSRRPTCSPTASTSCPSCARSSPRSPRPRAGSSRRAAWPTSRTRTGAGLSAEHYLGAPELSGIEVFNGGCEQQQGNGLSVVHWDGDPAAAAGSCHGIATDDSHYTGQDSRLAWTMVRAPERSRAAVLEALRTGCFYARAGRRSTTSQVHADGASTCAARRRARSTLRSGIWDGCKVNAGPLEMNWRGRVTERAGRRRRSSPPASSCPSSRAGAASRSSAATARARGRTRSR